MDDDSCSFCHRELETLVHFFWKCPKVQDFIQKINQELFAYNKLKKWALFSTLSSFSSPI